MTIVSKRKFSLALVLPLSIFLACTLITFTSKFKEHPNSFTTPILLDLIITAPLVYYKFIRKTSISRFTVTRVLMAGIFLASLLLSKNSHLLQIVKNVFSPLIELTVVFFLFKKFYTVNKNFKENNNQKPDFLVFCRALMKSLLGSEKMANIISSEVAVFYYIFYYRKRNTDYKTTFSNYKENGVILVLGTFLGLFIIETISMHFLFLLLNKTIAWVISGLSLYTCLQLYAHINAIKARLVIISDNKIYLRNGLMGGEAIISLDNIMKIEITKKALPGQKVVKLALIKGIENHNLAIHLIQPVTVIKAFGIEQTADTILLAVDRPQDFLSSFEQLKMN